LHKLLSGEGVTVLNQTPSAFQELVRSEEDLGRVDSEGKLRLVIFGGEALNPAMLRPWFDRHGADRPRLVNMYGITETTVHVTYRPVSPTDVGSGGSPIGVPIADLKVHLVDRWQQLVPLGVAGEMLFGGAGVAVGYLGRPVLTAERFVPDPFAAAPGLRLYRSGDLARRRPDGELEYLGRIDQQVKIRGFRIELGEIEQALRLHPGVQDAVAMAREVAGGGRRLVAYFVPSPEAPLLTPEELRSLLLDKLPEYMVPAAFVKLQSLPLSPNGKLDRHALPAPGLVRPEEDLAEPRTTAERILVQIWSEVLGTPQVGIHDNFFALGGDSILSLLIVSRAGRAGLQLAPRQLFQHQTIAELATVTGAAGEAQAEQGEVAGEAPLTPIQHFFLDSLPSDPHHFNQALLLEVRQAVDPVRLRAAIEVLQRQHDALRLRFERRENGWRQFHATSQAPAPFTLFALEGLPPAMRTAAVSAVAAEMQTSLDLLSGPLLRVALFELGEGKTGRFFLVAHHLVVDGVSWRILLEDLESAYSQLQSGEAVRLPPKTTSFRQWAWRLEEHARSRAVEEEMPYWLDRRRAAVTRLPVDRQRGFNPASLARIVQVSLDPERTRDLLRRVPETFRTQVNDVLLTALARALSDWTGARRLLVDLEGHGREEIAGDLDVSRTVGWFTTLFPVLLEIDPAETPVETLKSVKEQLRLITGAGLGYGLLRYLKGPEVAEPLRALPQAEVSFNYLGQVDHVLPEASPFARAQEATGPARSPSQPRSHLLDVDGIVVGERLQVNWTYGEGIHDRATVERLAGRFMEELRTLIEHCLCLEAGGFTPSDFPLARLDQETLDRLTSGLSAIEDIYPLLPLQHGLLFHSLQAPGSGVYVQQLSCTLVGDLEVDAFKNAWQALIDRHTVLRTGFASQHLEEPLQIVYHQARIPVEEQDWSDLPGDDFLSWLAAFLQADRERGFDLSRAPLMRLSLIRLGPGLCHLVWTYHHLVLDGWSIPILLREVFGFYGAILRKRQLDLVPAPPYRAYIEWFQRQDGAQTESFWRGLLKGFVPTPLARSATGEAGEIVERSLLLTAEESQAIVEMVRRCQLTLNTLAQGAWSLVLSHLGESDDVAFGTTISVRPPALAGVEAMLGVLLNTLPVRVRISSQERLIDWLRRLQTQQSEMRQYEHAPLAEVQRWSEVPRGSQLFESTLTVQNYPVDQALREQDTGLEIRDVRFIEKATYPVSMALMPAARIPLQIRYDSRRFDAASGERFLQLFKILLCAFAAREEAPIPWFRDVLEDYDRQQRTAQEEEYQEARRQKLKVVRRRSLQMTGGADAKGEGKP
jgi:non-ribosomal peptide synthase protein (TIGR01720 family)